MKNSPQGSAEHKVRSIYLVENHERYLSVLTELFHMLDDFDVCGSALNGEAALKDISDLRPDIVCIDLSLPTISGVDLIAEVLKVAPATACVILSAHSEPEYVHTVMAKGARGYILKGRSAQILEGVRAIAAGQIYVSPEMAVNPPEI